MIGDDRYERAGVVATVVAIADQVVHVARSRAVLVRGEPGIGKSTIISGSLDRLGSQWTVIRASGKALGRHRAHQTVASALGRLLDSLDARTRDELVAGLGALGRLVEGVHPDPPGGNADDLGRAYQAVTLLVTRLAARRPLAIVVDDLHWADDASVELLEHLVAELVDAPVLWLLAARPAEAHHRDDVRRFVATLERSSTTTCVDVPRLLDDDVRRRWSDATGSTADDDVVRRAHGNPLVLAALARQRRTGGSTPSYVADLFADEVVHLEESTRDLLLGIAVADRSVQRAELTALMDELGHRPTETERAVGRLLAAGLIEVGPDGIDVGHPVVGEVVHGQAPVPMSRRIHAAWLSCGRHSFDAAERARLTVGAGSDIAANLAVEALVEAADRAGVARARNAELAWIEHAVRRARELPGDDGAATLAGLLLRLARVLDGRPERAADAAREAIEVASGAHLWELAVTATLSLARSQLWSESADRVLALCRRAVEIGAGADQHTNLLALEGACRLIALLGRPADEVAAAADAAHEAACALGLEQRGEVVRSMSTLTSNPYVDAESWRRLAADSAGLRSAAGASLFSAAAVGWVAELDLLAGRWGEALEMANDPRLAAWRRLAVEFDVAFSQGRWDDAHELLVDSSWLGPHPIVDVCARRLAAHRGHAWTPSAQLVRRSPEFEATIELVDLFERQMLGGATDRAVPTIDGVWVTMSEAWARPMLAEVLVAAGRDDDAARVVERLMAMGEHGDRTHAAALRLRALLDRESAGAARALAAQARSKFEALGMVFDAARMCIDAIERGLLPPDPADLTEVVALLEQIGAVDWAVRARRLLGSTAADAPLARAMLTARELEVARLVAEGRSNAEIAAHLVVSVRTVTSHLDHAYTKLGVGSRAALAVYVLRLDRDTHSGR